MKMSWGVFGLLFALAISQTGCSSLPKHEVQHSELNSRTASFHKQGAKSYRAGRYEKAVVFFEQALAIHASVDDRPGVARSLSSIGRARIALGEWDSAEVAFLEARQSVFGLQQPTIEARALGGLGTVELHRQDPEAAKTWFQKALELPLADPCPERAVLLHDLASANRKLGNFEAAENGFRLALAMHETLQDALGIASDCYSLAILLDENGDPQQALSLARRALTKDKKAQNPQGVAQDLTLLGLLSSRSGSDSQAVDYYRRAKLAWLALGRTDKVEQVAGYLKTMG